METTIWVLGIVVFLALAFDFINGFHDTANAIATSVSTRALTPRRAIILAAVLNFVGAMMFTGVAKTLGGSVTDPTKLDNGVQVVIVTLIAAIIWNLVTWWFGIPSSSSQALIGALAGAVFVGAGSDKLKWSGFTDIVAGLLLSPLIAFAIRCRSSRQHYRRSLTVPMMHRRRWGSLHLRSLQPKYRIIWMCRCGLKFLLRQLWHWEHRLVDGRSSKRWELKFSKSNRLTALLPIFLLHPLFSQQHCCIFQ